MNCYKKYKKLRLYVNGVAVEPAQYIKGETFEYVPADSLSDCINYDKVPHFRNVEGYICELQPEFKDVDGYICELFTPTKIYDASNMFLDRTDIRSTDELELWRYDFSECTIAENMFRGCTNLEIVDLSGFAKNIWIDGSKSPLNLDYMFYGCTNLKEVYLPDLPPRETNVSARLSYMFNGCTNLEIVDIGRLNYWNGAYGSVAYMFYGCRNLKEITCSGGIYNAYNYNNGQIRGYSSTGTPGAALITWHLTDQT